MALVTWLLCDRWNFVKLVCHTVPYERELLLAGPPRDPLSIHRLTTQTPRSPPLAGCLPYMSIASHEKSRRPRAPRPPAGSLRRLGSRGGSRGGGIPSPIGRRAGRIDPGAPALPALLTRAPPMYDPAAFERPACGADRGGRPRARRLAGYNWVSEANIVVETLSVPAFRRPAARERSAAGERLDVAA